MVATSQAKDEIRRSNIDFIAGVDPDKKEEFIKRVESIHDVAIIALNGYFTAGTLSLHGRNNRGENFFALHGNEKLPTMDDKKKPSDVVFPKPLLPRSLGPNPVRSELIRDNVNAREYVSIHDFKFTHYTSTTKTVGEPRTWIDKIKGVTRTREVPDTQSSVAENVQLKDLPCIDVLADSNGQVPRGKATVVTYHAYFLNGWHFDPSDTRANLITINIITVPKIAENILKYIQDNPLFMRALLADTLGRLEIDFRNETMKESYLPPYELITDTEPTFTSEIREAPEIDRRR